MKQQLNLKCGCSTDRSGSEGAPARQYTSSTLTPRDRRVFRRLPQFSLLPCRITREIQSGLSDTLNLCRISPSLAKNLYEGGKMDPEVFLLVFQTWEEPKMRGPSSHRTWGECLLPGSEAESRSEIKSSWSHTLRSSLWQETDESFFLASSIAEGTPEPTRVNIKTSPSPELLSKPKQHMSFSL